MRLATLLMLLLFARQDPQFRGGVELVTVDVRVVAPDGTALTGLAAADFSLEVDGKPRAIKSLQLVRVKSSGDAGTVGRTLIFLFDHESIRPGNERAAVQGAIKILGSLDPLDRVAVITLPDGRIEANLTSDFDAVRRALTRVLGRAADLPNGMVAGMSCPLLALHDFLTGLQRVEGVKTIVLVSEGFGCSQSVRSRLDDPRDPDDLATLAAAARAQFYVVQPNNAMIIDASRRLSQGLPDADVERRDKATNMLEDIASVTGGDLFRLSASADNVFERVLLETSAYYELAFEPLQSERNSRDHSISVKANRAKLRVRARPSFSIAPRRQLVKLLSLADYRRAAFPVRAVEIADRSFLPDTPRGAVR